jgi:hypothetical protein
MEIRNNRKQVKKKIKKIKPIHDYDYLGLKYKFLQKHVYLNN